MGYGTTVSLAISDCGGPGEYDRLSAIARAVHDILSSIDKNGAGLNGSALEDHICKYVAKDAVLFTLRQIIEQRLPVVESSYAYAGIAFTTQFRNLNTQSYVALMSEFISAVLDDDEFKFCHGYLITEDEQHEHVMFHHYVLNYDTDQPEHTSTSVENPRGVGKGLKNTDPVVSVDLNLSELTTLLQLAKLAEEEGLGERAGIDTDRFNAFAWRLIGDADLVVAQQVKKIIYGE